MYFVSSAYCYNGVQDDWNKETGVDCGGDICGACGKYSKIIITQITKKYIVNC